MTSKGGVEQEVCAAMLDHTATLLKHTRRVTFLADRGFRGRDWAKKCRSLGWDYSIRLANNTTITFPGGVVATAEALGIKPGQRCYLSLVGLYWFMSTFGDGNMSADVR